jgi:hypothetical protein
MIRLGAGAMIQPAPPWRSRAGISIGGKWQRIGAPEQVRAATQLYVSTPIGGRS